MKELIFFTLIGIGEVVIFIYLWIGVFGGKVHVRLNNPMRYFKKEK